MTPTEDELARPLTAEEEARWRAYIEAAVREVDVVKGGLFDMSARLFATLDALRASPVAETAGIDAAREELRMALREAVTNLPQPTLGLTGGVNRGAVIDAIERAFAAALRTPKPEGEPE